MQKTIEKQGFSKSVSSKKKHILVVEDEKDTSTFIKTTLEVHIPFKIDL